MGKWLEAHGDGVTVYINKKYIAAVWKQEGSNSTVIATVSGNRFMAEEPYEEIKKRIIGDERERK